ncbi:hypothetical protein HPB47_026017, partial [Ixodes persulcatus]
MLVELYRTTLRFKKWYLKVFFHLIDVVVVNYWLLYRRDADAANITKKGQLTLLKFKAEIAWALRDEKKISTPTRRKALSDVEDQLEAKKRRGPMAVIPSALTLRMRNSPPLVSFPSSVSGSALRAFPITQNRVSPEEGKEESFRRAGRSARPGLSSGVSFPRNSAAPRSRRPARSQRRNLQALLGHFAPPY